MTASAEGRAAADVAAFDDYQRVPRELPTPAANDVRRRAHFVVDDQGVTRHTERATITPPHPPERNRTVTTENPADATETDDRADTPAADTEAANEAPGAPPTPRWPAQPTTTTQTAAVELSRDELKAALSAVDGFCRIMRHNNRPVWLEVEVLRDRLERAHTRLARKTRADSPTRSWEREPVPTSNVWMTTGEAATALRMSHRALQLRATELDAVKRGGRWWFPSATIRDMQRYRGIEPTWPD